MHRAATAARAAGPLPIKLGHHGFEITALRKVMTVGTMVAHHRVLPRERRTGADGHGLLPNAKVDGTTHLLLGIERGDLFLDDPDPEHLTEETQ